MNDFKKRGFKNAMQKKREEQERIAEWSDSGKCEELLKKVREKAKPSIKIDDLPF